MRGAGVDVQDSNLKQIAAMAQTGDPNREYALQTAMQNKDIINAASNGVSTSFADRVATSRLVSKLGISHMESTALQKQSLGDLKGLEGKTDDEIKNAMFKMGVEVPQNMDPQKFLKESIRAKQMHVATFGGRSYGVNGYDPSKIMDAIDAGKSFDQIGKRDQLSMNQLATSMNLKGGGESIYKFMTGDVSGLSEGDLKALKANDDKLKNITQGGAKQEAAQLELTIGKLGDVLSVFSEEIKNLKPSKETEDKFSESGIKAALEGPVKIFEASVGKFDSSLDKIIQILAKDAGIDIKQISDKKAIKSVQPTLFGPMPTSNDIRKKASGPG
jgi:hypothetical protein